MERTLTDAIVTPVRLAHPPPPKPQPRSVHGLRLPMLLERLSELTTKVSLPRRNSPIMEVSEDGSVYNDASNRAAEEEAAREVLPPAVPPLAATACLLSDSMFWDRPVLCDHGLSDKCRLFEDVWHTTAHLVEHTTWWHVTQLRGLCRKSVVRPLL